MPSTQYPYPMMDLHWYLQVKMESYVSGKISDTVNDEDNRDYNLNLIMYIRSG